MGANGLVFIYDLMGLLRIRIKSSICTTRLRKKHVMAASLISLHTPFVCVCMCVNTCVFVCEMQRTTEEKSVGPEGEPAVGLF